ncbi:M48 family metallopeptidase [Candidatus Nitrospira bockiana]
MRIAGLHRSTLALLLLALGAVAACETNPYTKRSQFLAVPESYEKKLGAQAYQQVLSDPKVKVSSDPREVQAVTRVATRIIDAAKQSKYADLAKTFDWDVTVIKDDQMKNAFALPGGKIAVYTGIFPIAKNEAGLAAIMGHEVVHALARHGAERMSQGALAQAAITAATVGAASQGLDPKLAQLAGGALANYGFILPYSRKHESEADYIGLLLAAQAGYDPREAVHIWERMEAAAKGQPPEFLSTHPSHGTRIQQLQEHMPEALAVYERAPRAPAAELPAVAAP